MTANAENSLLDAHTSSHLGSTRRDIAFLLLFVFLAVLFVFLFDTNSIAEWVAEHRESKIDETIVAGIALCIGLCVFSVRRWIDLSRQVKRFAELHDEMDKLTAESAVLAELGDLLQSCLSPTEAHKLIAEYSQMLFPGFSGAICVTASSRDMVEAVAQWGHPALLESHFPPGDCWALRRGRMHHLRAENLRLCCPHIGKGKPHDSVCVPMMAQGEALGVLYLDTGFVADAPPDDAPTGPLFSESHLRLSRSLAEHIALALANLNLREVLRSQSIRDALTGLYNRRYMEESLEREIRRAARKNASLGVMMIDVDHFKRFNDTFGHDAGDALLRELAKVFKGHFRGEDIVCRYGGEEFTVILPDANLTGTFARAESFREAAKTAVTQYRGQPLDPVTLSVGVASYPDKGQTSEGLLRAADSALYRAKEEGRDRVQLA